jgi:hypothetical protein
MRSTQPKRRLSNEYDDTQERSEFGRLVTIRTSKFQSRAMLQPPPKWVSLLKTFTPDRVGILKREAEYRPSRVTAGGLASLLAERLSDRFR